MDTQNELKTLTDKFAANLTYYKDHRNAYNEHSCRIEYIDPLLQLLGWDVSNAKGLPPQYREVIAENYSTQTDRPDYSLTLRGVAKLFVEAKKPAVDIFRHPEPALQARKYGWNANHKVAVLTNFEYLIIYDTTVVPREGEACPVARYRFFHFTDYARKFDEICSLISRDVIYSGAFDAYFDEHLLAGSSQKQQVDTLFLEQINRWRVSLSNELYHKDTKYRSLDVLNDVVQDFINQIVFLRICEDKNLPLYHNLQETISDPAQLNTRLEEMLRAADRRYDSGLFSGNNIVFDLSNAVITEIVQGLYYPQSPYLFSIIESNLLGKIYEMFLTEQLAVLPGGAIGLAKKKDYADRSIVTTPTEIVKYIVEQTMSRLCEGKTPQELLELRIADPCMGSGHILVYAFDVLMQIYESVGVSPREAAKLILEKNIYGLDIDRRAYQLAYFSLMMKARQYNRRIFTDGVKPQVYHPAGFPDGEEYGSLVKVDELPSKPELPKDQLSVFDDYERDLRVWNFKRLLAQKYDVVVTNPPYMGSDSVKTKRRK